MWAFTWAVVASLSSLRGAVRPPADITPQGGEVGTWMPVELQNKLLKRYEEGGGVGTWMYKSLAQDRARRRSAPALPRPAEDMHAARPSRLRRHAAAVR